jgi:hypothetical protein
MFLLLIQLKCFSILFCTTGFRGRLMAALGSQNVRERTVGIHKNVKDDGTE